MSHFYGLNFADNAWHFFAATFIFLMGAWIALVQYRLFLVPQCLALCLYFWHTICSLFYLFYSQSNSADAAGYFLSSLDFNEFPAPGTSAVTFLTSLFTQQLNLSYGGVFLVFNIAGFVGLLAFASVVLSLTQASSRNLRFWALCILMLPGLNFWSAAIGKDTLTFLGACLACWVSMDLISRFPGMILACLLFFVARPHMAAVLLIALSVTMIISGRGSVMTRLFLVFVTISTATFSLFFAQTYVGLEGGLTGIEINDFVEQRQSYNTEGGLGIEIANMSIPARMLTYLFRPLFVDGGGFLGQVISVENAILLVFSIFAMYFLIRGRKSSLPEFAWRFLVIYSLVSWFILANTTSNLGIAMRQKWMFVPMILVLCFSYVGRPSNHAKTVKN
jgi:hypothetical protein